MSRRDNIIALALRRNNGAKESPSSAAVKVTKSLETLNLQQPTSKVTHNISTATDIGKLWSRPLDFNDFSEIFDHRNEYSNSTSIVRDINTAMFLDHFPNSSSSHISTYQHDHNTRRSLICYENMPSVDNDLDLNDDYYNSDDSVKDKDYVAETVKRRKRNALNSFDTEEATRNRNETQIIVRADIHDVPSTSKPSSQKSTDLPIIVSKPHNAVPTGDIIVITSSQTATEETAPVNTPQQDLTLPPSNDKGFTKSGVRRKRRKLNIPVSERLKMKKDNDDEKLSLKPPCDEKCRRKCTSKINNEERQVILNKYLHLNYESRGIYIKSMIETYTPKVRKVSNEEQKRKRERSNRFYFAVNESRIEVCKKFFLTTLGYHANNNRRIYTALKKEIDEQKDRRGSYVRTGVIDKDIIRAHIQNYNPMISHYRREHAPNKFYLPSDINITMMHQNFIEKYPGMSVSFETYRKTLRDMNISFTHLGHEECEQCALFKIHENSSECNEEPCEKCVQYKKHKLRYTTTRKAYKKDVELSLSEQNHIYVSVDLQKVIMLPRMDQYKSAIFCPRIIAFNESFVPLGKSKDHVPYAVLWNETISGRRQEDIISTFRAFLLSTRDAKEIFIWADNCAAQNKNWAFICFLINMVNSDLICAETITVKYFEPGHTFMSADHFHHQVEMTMKNKKIYDYEDFIDAIKNSNSKRNVVKNMLVSDFFYYEDVSSQHKLKNTEPRVYLKDIMSVKAEKGDFSIKYKESHDGDWKTLDFLQAKIKKLKSFPEFPCKKSPRGVTKERKEEIISKLVRLMPENRRRFWSDLPMSNYSTPSLD